MDHDVIFYDGHCALCHRSVKRVLDAGPASQRFRVSPLQGETIKRLLSDEQRDHLPDSIVVLTHERALLTGSDAVLYILDHLGEDYRTHAKWLRRVPRPLRRLGYRVVSITRKWLFKRPEDRCQTLTPAQRERYLP